MPITLYADIDVLLDELRTQIQGILGENLVGLYLYGSLVTGDYDPGISDVDLLAVIAGGLTAEEFAGLDALHHAFVAAHPEWEERVEIAYLSQEALKTFRTQASPIAIISPGEPFHVKAAGRDWLINWWVVRRQGVTLSGPPAVAVIDPIDDAEFHQAVRDQVSEWRSYVLEMRSRKSQAYAILTLCRALYAERNGEQASKRQAAMWAAAYLPQWAPLILNALAWRVAAGEEGVDHDATLPAAVEFVTFVADLIGA